MRAQRSHLSGFKGWRDSTGWRVHIQETGSRTLNGGALSPRWRKWFRSTPFATAHLWQDVGRPQLGQPSFNFNLTTGKNTNRTTQGITGRTLDALFWMFAGSGVQAVLQWLVLVVLARLLAPADFGLVSAALVVVGLSENLARLGVGPAVVQLPHIETRHLRTGFTLSVLFGLLLAGLIWLLSPGIAGFFRMKELTPILRALGLVFPFSGASVMAESLLQRELQFRRLAGIQVVSYAVGYSVVGIGLAQLGFGAWALVGANLAQRIVKSAILLIVQPCPKLPQIERGAFKELMYFGGGFTLARISGDVAIQGDNLIVGRWLGAEALGLYDRAYQLMLLPATLLGQVLDSVLFPAMAKVQHEPERLATAYRRGVALIALLVLPMSAAIFVLAPELIHVLLGPAWKDAIVPFQILTVGMLFRTSYKMSDSLARATGAVYRRAWRQGIYAALVVGGAWVGQHWGTAGVAYGVLGAITVNFILMAQLSLSLTSMTWKSFVAVHFPAISLTAIVCTEVWVVSLLIRNVAMPAILLLSVAMIVAAISLLVLVRLTPKFVLGQDGVWMLKTLNSLYST